MADTPEGCPYGGDWGIEKPSQSRLMPCQSPAADCASLTPKGRAKGSLRLIEQGKIDTTPLITHRYKLEDIEEAYRIFENKLDGVIKVVITP